jgi:hypothetical protein
MRALLLGALVPAALVAGLGADEGQAKRGPDGKLESTACHGTSVSFVDTPVEAARLASREKKLVLVLHVSGYFEDPDFT